MFLPEKNQYEIIFFPYRPRLILSHFEQSINPCMQEKIMNKRCYRIAVGFAFSSLPVISFSLICFAGGSSVSQGVDWLMGVCPQRTLLARTWPGVCVPAAGCPETCFNKRNISSKQTSL